MGFDAGIPDSSAQPSANVWKIQIKIVGRLKFLIKINSQMVKIYL